MLVLEHKAFEGVNSLCAGLDDVFVIVSMGTHIGDLDVDLGR